MSKLDAAKEEGLRMLGLRLNLMKNIDTGTVSEPSALLGLDGAGP